jgi:hypothetical protein
MANDIARRDDNYVPAMLGVDENTGEVRAIKTNADGELLVTGTASVAPDSSVQKIIVSKNGTDVGERQEVNLIEGSNVTLTVTDNAVDNRVDVTITATGGGGGDVSKVGTPVNNQVGVWTGDGTIEGDPNLTFDTATDTLTTVNIVGALTGNASTATALQTARTINGTSFDGTANITVTADAGTLTGTTLNATVVSSSLTSVGTLASGNATAIVDAASTSAQGKVELAIASEVNTGTSDTLAVTPDALSGSTYGTAFVELQPFLATTTVAIGDLVGGVIFRVPAELNGWNLVSVGACVMTAGTTGTTDIQIRNITQAADMLSTKITIDSTELDSKDATAPPVIDTDEDDVATGDQIRIDVDAVSTTPPLGLVVTLGFRLP